MSGYVDELERELVRAADAYQRRRLPVGRLRGRAWRPASGTRRWSNLGGAFAFVASASVAVRSGLRSWYSVTADPIEPVGERQAAHLDAGGSASATDRGGSCGAAIAGTQLSANIGQIVPSLTRRVATIGHTGVFMFVTTAADAHPEFPHGPLWSPTLGDRVVVMAGFGASADPVPAVELDDPEAALGAYVDPSTQKQYFLGVVPAGQAGSTDLSPRLRRGGGHQQHGRRSAARPQRKLRAVTWFEASGRVIPTDHRRPTGHGAGAAREARSARRSSAQDRGSEPRAGCAGA